MNLRFDQGFSETTDLATSVASGGADQAGLGLGVVGPLSGSCGGLM